jgi:hypothetical protein
MLTFAWSYVVNPQVYRPDFAQPLHLLLESLLPHLAKHLQVYSMPAGYVQDRGYNPAVQRAVNRVAEKLVAQIEGYNADIEGRGVDAEIEDIVEGTRSFP